MNTSYIINYTDSYILDVCSYETSDKYIYNIQGTNRKSNVTWGKIAKKSEHFKLELYKIATHVIYIKNREKRITKSSEFFLNYGARYWFGHKLIRKCDIVASDKNIKERKRKYTT
jgi:hypothetical protein